MANKIYANGMEIACKAGAGKTICAMPDVCFTPPENPATPPGLPVPYPNTGLASDTTEGSKTVMISGKEIMLKNKSYFKTSTGDEAGCAAKKGLISSNNAGKVYFIKWSMDVKFEGENVDRHLDMTTNNHASPMANEAVPWPFLDKMTASLSKEEKTACAKDRKKEKAACKNYKDNKKKGIDVCAKAGVASDFTHGKGATTLRTISAHANPCLAARRCRLLPFNAKPRDGINGCCPAQTPDHLVPKSSFFKKSVEDGVKMNGWGKYNVDDAPCMCLEGGSCSGSHGLRSAFHKAFSDFENGDKVLFKVEVEHCAASAHAVAPQCDPICIAAQLRMGHEKMVGKGNTEKEIKHSSSGKNFKEEPGTLLSKIEEMLPKKS